MRSAVTGGPEGPVAAASASASKNMQASRPWAPPPGKPPQPEGRLLDRLGERLVASLEQPQMDLFIKAADAAELGRMALAAGLSAEERAAFAERFAAYRRDIAALERRKEMSRDEKDDARKKLTAEKEAWVAEKLGAERKSKVDGADRVFAMATAEHDAARVVSRVSDAADLTTEQKDRLYATLVERVQNPPPAAVSTEDEDEALKFRVHGSMKEEPPVPDISEEARAILTPEQWEVHEQSRDLSARQQQAMMDAIKSMAPSATVVLQEVLNETAPGQQAAPPAGGKQ